MDNQALRKLFTLELHQYERTHSITLPPDLFANMIEQKLLLLSMLDGECHFVEDADMYLDVDMRCEKWRHLKYLDEYVSVHDPTIWREVGCRCRSCE